MTPVTRKMNSRQEVTALLGIHSNHQVHILDSLPKQLYSLRNATIRLELRKPQRSSVSPVTEDRHCGPSARQERKEGLGKNEARIDHIDVSRSGVPLEHTTFLESGGTGTNQPPVLMIMTGKPLHDTINLLRKPPTTAPPEKIEKVLAQCQCRTAPRRN